MLMSQKVMEIYWVNILIIDGMYFNCHLGTQPFHGPPYAPYIQMKEELCPRKKTFLSDILGEMLTHYSKARTNFDSFMTLNLTPLR